MGRQAHPGWEPSLEGAALGREHGARVPSLGLLLPHSATSQSWMPPAARKEPSGRGGGRGLRTLLAALGSQVHPQMKGAQGISHKDSSRLIKIPEWKSRWRSEQRLCSLTQGHASLLSNTPRTGGHRAPVLRRTVHLAYYASPRENPFKNHREKREL